MARLKITEYTAKTTLAPAFNLTYQGMPLTINTPLSAIRTHFHNQNLVLKVDQGVKKRGLNGLVKLNLTPIDIPAVLKSWHQAGWTNFLAEPLIEHDSSVERYLSLERTRDGWHVIYNQHGGINVESHWDNQLALPSSLRHSLDQKLIPLLDQYHISFIEINPLLIRDNQLIPLDMAVYVDAAASSLPTLPDRALSNSEAAIATLDAATAASLKYRLLNPQGSIWMLLSGGGASLVLADEVADLGLGSMLANYGEYSGAPKADDVYSYTKIILGDLLASPASRKTLVIAGGVANFTDVKKTFTGLIKALKEKQSELASAKLKVYVRRGGPNEKAGLTQMRDFLSQAGLLGSVYGHEVPLTQVITDVKTYLQNTTI